MIIKNHFYSLELSDENGSILSYCDQSQNFISSAKKPLLEIKLLDKDGNGIYTNSSTAQEFSVVKQDDVITLIYKNIIDGLSASVTLRCPENEPFCYWSCEIENNTGNIIEWFGLPGIITPDDLKGTGGESEIFWPFGEGCLIDDVHLRDESKWLHYRELTYQSSGYNGLYPGPTAMQFMAYYNDLGGLYIAAQDTNAHLKSFENYPADGGICLEVRMFADGAIGHYKMDYELVSGVFYGDWCDAAEIYRSWIENTKNFLPEKICDNTELPEWYHDSPVTAIYPIRGRRDYGDMTPNMYYPYKNVLPYVDEYSEKFNSRIMALPMHWEGTAPWAPPYVWPPYGGEEQFREFANELHKKNNLLGVYCSGIGWTTHSYLDDIDISDKYQDKFICRTPDNKILQSGVLGPPIRDGYDMCPESDEVAEIVKHEVEALADAGCDYTQYFDQNLGGNSCMCYSKDHGHPPAPGKWQSDAMIRIFKKATENIKKSKMLIGCEAAAAECFMKHLSFNDLRYNICLHIAKPVPAYSYVFHEYINNFMGNQNSIHKFVDMMGNPDNTLFRIAYSFAAGDMLSVSLDGKGKLFWGWDVDWDTPEPNQEAIYTLIGNINPWRRGFAKKYLHYGRMIKAEKVNNDNMYQLHSISGRIVEYPEVLVTAFESQNKEKAMLLTNYLGKENEIVFPTIRKIRTNPTDENEYIVSDRIVLKPHSAVIAEMTE